MAEQVGGVNPSEMVHEDGCDCPICEPTGYRAQKERLLNRLHEDVPSHESVQRLRMRAEWNEQMERDCA